MQRPSIRRSHNVHSFLRTSLFHIAAQRNGVALADGGPVSGVHTPTLSISSTRSEDTDVYHLAISIPSCTTITTIALVVPNRCPTDYNLGGDINTQDIFDFLAAWFAGSPAADYNGVNGLEVQDVLEFVNS